MSKIILQPCGSSIAKEHFYHTVNQKVYLNSIKNLLGDTHFENLKQIYPEGSCMIWGVTPSGSNISKWTRIEVGDVALFSGNKKIFASATVTYKLQNISLAAHLWDSDEKGNTWEYIYFLDELINNHKIPYVDFNKAVGYDPKYIIQGFNVMDVKKSQKFLNRYELESEVHVPEISPEEYEQAVKKLSELQEPEVEYLTKIRKEQRYLKKQLFGDKKIAECACCHEKFPVSFLITAHIKKRSFCTVEEKLDPNIVMPMCRFGCDELYEKGYVGVRGGVFVSLEKTPSTKYLKGYLDKISGNNCSYHNERTVGYFDWHLGCHEL